MDAVAEGVEEEEDVEEAAVVVEAEAGEVEAGAEEVLKAAVNFNCRQLCPLSKIS